MVPFKFHHISIQRFQRNSKNVSAMRTVEEVGYFCFFVKFRQIQFNLFKEGVENVSANQRPGLTSCSLIRPKIENMVEDDKFLLPVNFEQIPFSDFREKG